MIALALPTFGLLPKNIAVAALNVSDPTNCLLIRAKSEDDNS